jgi:hypothetical protein
MNKNLVYETIISTFELNNQIKEKNIELIELINNNNEIIKYNLLYDCYCDETSIIIVFNKNAIDSNFFKNSIHKGDNVSIIRNILMNYI